MEKAWEFAVVSKKFEIKIGDKSVLYETDAELGKQVGGILGDLISPFSEGFGAIGDKIRFFREKSAAEILAKAKNIADENSINLGEVKPRVMIEWAEAASAEDTSSTENLSDLWANLLVNAANEDTGAELRYISILSQLTPRHAKMLQDIYDAAENISNNRSHLQQSKITEHFIDQFINDIGDYISENKIKKEFVSEEEVSGFYNIFMRQENFLHILGCSIVTAYVEERMVPTAQSMEDEDKQFQLSLDIDLLAQLGLITSFTRASVSSKGYRFVCKFNQISPLGIGFIEAVNKPRSVVENDQ